MAKYSKKAQDSVGEAMHRRKKGTLESGRSSKKVTSRKQAIAIGLSEAREKGAKVPAKKKSSAKKASGKKSSSKKSGAKRSGAKKASSKKSGAKKSSSKKSSR
jgi:hypothetical protein